MSTKQQTKDKSTQTARANKMSEQKESGKNGYVTYYKLFGILLAITTVLISGFTAAGSWAWSTHVDQPHRDAVERSEYIQDLKQFEGRIERMERHQDSRFNKIETKIDDIAEKVHQIMVNRSN